MELRLESPLLGMRARPGKRQVPRTPRLSGLTDGSCAVPITRVPETNAQIARIIQGMVPNLDRASSPLAPSPKGWLLSDSISRQASGVIAFGCLVGLIAALRGGELNLDAALAFSALIVAAMVLDVLRALSRRDPVYGLPLAWKCAFVVLAMMVAGIPVMVILVLNKSDSVSELWSLLYKAGPTEVLASQMFRRSDPKG